MYSAIENDDVGRMMQILDGHPDLFGYAEDNKSILWEKRRDWRMLIETTGSRRMILALLSRSDQEVTWIFNSSTIETGGMLSSLCFRWQDDPDKLVELFSIVLEHARRLIPMPEFLHMTYQGGNVCHAAAQFGHVQILKLLIDAGMSIATTDEIGGHLGHYATSATSSMAMLEFIYSLDPKNIARTDKSGKLPLHSAAENDRVDMCRFLLERHPEGLHALCNAGFSPLADAAMCFSKDAAVCLVRMGANPSPAGWGMSSKTNNVIRLLVACSESHIKKRMTMEEVVSVRYEVYFSQSLLERLLDL